MLATLHADAIADKMQHMAMYTEGHWWSDRVEQPSDILQRERLGGIALKRNQTWPGNTVSWRFDTPGENYYVQFIDRACRGDIDADFYDEHLRPVRTVSDKWWPKTVQKFGGALPVTLGQVDLDVGIEEKVGGGLRVGELSGGRDAYC